MSLMLNRRPIVVGSGTKQRSLKQANASHVVDETLLFPAEMKTKTDSVTLVQKLLGAAVSNICFMRGVFPQTCFATRQVDAYKLKILRGGHDDFPEVNQLIRCIRACCDAIMKGYLRSFTLGFFVNEDDPETVIEQYTYSIEETSDGNQSLVLETTGSKNCGPVTVDMSGLKKQTQTMIEQIFVVTSQMLELPETVFINIKLLYTHQTPMEYEPDGFEPSNIPAFRFKSDELVDAEHMKTTFKLGSVKTGFHSIRLHARSELFSTDSLDASSEFSVQTQVGGRKETTGNGQVSEVDQVIGPIEALSVSGTQESTIRTPSVKTTTQQRKDVKSNVPEIALSTKTGNANLILVDEEETMPIMSGGPLVEDCLCGLIGYDAIVLQCKGCGKKQHGACYGITDSSSVALRFSCCLSCYLNSPSFSNSVMDVRLKGLINAHEGGTKRITMVVMYRRALSILVSQKSEIIGETEFCFLLGKNYKNVELVQPLIHRLENSDAILSTTGSQSIKYRINQDKMLFAVSKRPDLLPDIYERTKKSKTTEVRTPRAAAGGLRLRSPANVNTTSNNTSYATASNDVSMDISGEENKKKTTASKAKVVSGQTASAKRGKNVKASNTDNTDKNLVGRNNENKKIDGKRDQSADASTPRKRTKTSGLNERIGGSKKQKKC